MLGLTLFGCALADPIDVTPTPEPAPAARTAAGPEPERPADAQAGGARAPRGAKSERVHHATREELIARLRGPLSQSSAGLTLQPRAGGGASLPLAGRFQHAMVARRDAGGRLYATCVDNPEAAAHALEARAP